ncbi:MAG: hypothetical protein U0271_28295 [Polyangiaceae bacterium]
MWVRRAAIRPVPAYARVPEHVLARLETDLGRDIAEEDDQSVLDEGLERFEREQPALAGHMAEIVARHDSEPALGFGYFLMIAVYLAFERAFGAEIDPVSELDITAVEEALRLDEDLRRGDAEEVVESDDVVSMEQPHMLRYVQDHVDAALEAHADEVDVDHVHALYRAVLVQILALSYAVRPPTNMPRDLKSDEFSA